MPSPALLIAIPLAVAALLSGLRSFVPRWLADSLGILTALTNFVLACFLVHAALHHSTVYWFGNWFPRGHMAIGIGFVIDLAGAGLAALTALITTLTLVFSWCYVESGGGYFHPLMLVFLAAMSGFCLTGDIFNLFVFFELMSTAAFALCGLKTGEPAPLAGAFNFAVTNTVAAFLVLNGIALLYGATGALNMAQMGALLTGRHDRLVLAAFVFLSCGFLIKSAAVPFHFWLPDAHAVAPTPVCVLFSGLMVEMGLFGLMRVYGTIFQNCFGPDHVHLIFVGLGSLTAIWGGIMCFAEHHLKRLLAFSTISHAGLMILGFGLWTRSSIDGVFVYLAGHAFIKASLFFLAGVLLHRLRSMSEPKLFRKGRPLRWTALLWFIAGFGLAGGPGLALMTGEVKISHATHAIEWVFFFAEMLTAAAVFRFGFRVFFGWGDPGPLDKSAAVDEMPETDQQHQKISWFLWMPAAICLACAGAMSFVPGLMNGAYSAAGRFLDFPTYLRVVYHSSQQLPILHAPAIPWSEGLLHGLLAVFLAAALALAAVFHERIPRALRLPSHMEGSMRYIRALQSGHPGDYVAWITAGAAVVGGFAFLLGLQL